MTWRDKNQNKQEESERARAAVTALLIFGVEERDIRPAMSRSEPMTHRYHYRDNSGSADPCRPAASTLLVATELVILRRTVYSF